MRSAREQVKAAGGPERGQAGTRRGFHVTKVAQMQVAEERVHGTRAAARKEAKNKRKVARVTAEYVGIVARRSIVPKRQQQQLVCHRSGGERHQ